MTEISGLRKSKYMYKSSVIESGMSHPVRASRNDLLWFIGPPKKTQDQLVLISWEVRDRGHELMGNLNSLISKVYQTMYSSVKEKHCGP